ncbi:hypothetical protein Zmor_015919 [Zophobas morio]|uniref:MD-2-related lipid-recognition domain-containing protein n=1 Tax=Zophobas morio TaxID=2755281 RepID=A0AA38MI03_9CUCU|nr:hypothetical protein Zmor_015919 [Zophobas morio]
MNFTSPRRLDHIAPQAVAETPILVVDLPLEQENACDGIVNTECPLEAGEDVEYTLQMSVSPVFGETPFAMEFLLLDVDKLSFFECFRADMQMVQTD